MTELFAYQDGRLAWGRYLVYGGSKEGVFLAGLSKWPTDEERADYEDGWIDASEEES